MDLLKRAKALTERVEAEATKAKVPVAVCIVDVHGNLVLQHRMNGAPLFALEISERKAYTSALVRMRTADLLALVQPGQPLYVLPHCRRRSILPHGRRRSLDRRRRSVRGCWRQRRHSRARRRYR
jgi:uncharacterized protein GlcG (DUF336 family)